MKVVGSFTDAIFALLGQFGDALSARGLQEHSVCAYMFGGCAVHLYARARVSNDMDLEVTTMLLSPLQLREAKGEAGYVLVRETEGDEPELLELDLAYNATIGPLHENFDTRAKELERVPGSPLVVMLPSREDLALTKLDRLSENDVKDILLLMQDPSADWALLEQLTSEVAECYQAFPGTLTSKLKYVMKHPNRSVR